MAFKPGFIEIEDSQGKKTIEWVHNLDDLTGFDRVVAKFPFEVVAEFDQKGALDFLRHLEELVGTLNPREFHFEAVLISAFMAGRKSQS